MKHAEDILFQHVDTVHNLGSVVDAMEEYKDLHVQPLEVENKKLREALESIKASDWNNPDCFGLVSAQLVNRAKKIAEQALKTAKP